MNERNVGKIYFTNGYLAEKELASYLYWLVDISNILCLYIRMLFASSNKLWECC